MTRDHGPTGASLQREAQRLIAYAREQAASIEHWASIVDQQDLAEDALPGLKVLRKIGRGGQSLVYEAVHLATRHRVAVKVLNRRVLDRPHEVARFRREAEILSRVRHPHIVTLRDANFTHDHPYLVMDFVDGEAIDDFIERVTPSIESLLELFIKISDAIHTAHVLGVVHRDLKPANILVDDNGVPHVVDFGLAKLRPEATGFPSTDSITEAGQFVGSFRWSSPEQARDDGASVGPRTDVYALGLMFYHALAGRFPYGVDGSLGRVLQNIQTSEPIRPSRIRKELDHDLETIVLHCLNKDPMRRYADAGELALDLRHRREGRPIAIRRDSTWYVLRRTMHRHRAWSIAALVAVVATIAFASTMTAMYARARRAEIASAKQVTATQNVVARILQLTFRKLDRIAGTDEVRQELAELSNGELARISEEGPSDTPQARDSRAIARLLAGEFAYDRGDWAEARDNLDSAVQLRKELAEEFPDNAEYRSAHSIALVKRGDVAGAVGDSTMQLDLYRQAMAIDKRLVAEHPEDLNLLDNLAWSYFRLAPFEPETGAGGAFFAEFRAIAERLALAEPNNATRQWLYFNAKARDLHQAISEGRWADADREKAVVARLLDSVLALEPYHLFFNEEMRKVLVSAAWAAQMQRENDLAAELLDMVDDALSQLPVRERSTCHGLESQAGPLACRAQIYASMEDFASQRQVVNRAIELLSRAESSCEPTPSLWTRLANFHVLKARLQIREGDLSGAEESARTAIALATRVYEDPASTADQLVSCASFFAGVDPGELRDISLAIAALERAGTRPGFRRDGKFYDRIVHYLVTDGQLDRARALQQEGLAAISPNDTVYRPRLLKALPRQDGTVVGKPNSESD